MWALWRVVFEMWILWEKDCTNHKCPQDILSGGEESKNYCLSPAVSDRVLIFLHCHFGACVLPGNPSCTLLLHRYFTNNNSCWQSICITGTSINNRKDVSGDPRQGVGIMREKRHLIYKRLEHKETWFPWACWNQVPWVVTVSAWQ